MEMLRWGDATIQVRGGGDGGGVGREGERVTCGGDVLNAQGPERLGEGEEREGDHEGVARDDERAVLGHEADDLWAAARRAGQSVSRS